MTEGRPIHTQDIRPRITRAEAIQAAGELAAEQYLARLSMTPREQAEAAWSPTSPYSVDELEDLIREDRDLPPLVRDPSRAIGGARRQDRRR